MAPSPRSASAWTAPSARCPAAGPYRCRPGRALLLDEPAHHLDRASVRQLTSALTECRGALLVAAHDLEFLRSPGITRWLLLDGELRELAAGEVEEALKG